MVTDNTRFIALGSRLQGVPEVKTLGLKPNFKDYTPQERGLILNSKRILFPTLNYAQFLTTMGKEIFPSLETYLYADEKIKQTTLFYMLGIPHPRTRTYYHLHHKDILRDFDFPFIAVTDGRWRGRQISTDLRLISSFDLLGSATSMSMGKPRRLGLAL